MGLFDDVPRLGSPQPQMGPEPALAPTSITPRGEGPGLFDDVPRNRAAWPSLGQLGDQALGSAQQMAGGVMQQFAAAPEAFATKPSPAFDWRYPVLSTLGQVRSGIERLALGAEALLGAPILPQGRAWIGEQGREMAGAGKSRLEAAIPPGEPSVPQQILQSAVQSAPQFAGSILATLAGGPAAGTAVAGAATMGQGYADCLSKGGDPATCQAYALEQGSIESLFELSPMRSVVQPGLRLIRRMLQTSGKEAASEVATQAAQGPLNVAYGFDPSIRPRDETLGGAADAIGRYFMEQYPREALIAGGAGAIMGAPGGLVGHPFAPKPQPPEEQPDPQAAVDALERLRAEGSARAAPAATLPTQAAQPTPEFTPAAPTPPVLSQPAAPAQAPTPPRAETFGASAPDRASAHMRATGQVSTDGLVGYAVGAGVPAESIRYLSETAPNLASFEAGVKALVRARLASQASPLGRGASQAETLENTSPMVARGLPGQAPAPAVPVGPPEITVPQRPARRAEPAQAGEMMLAALPPPTQEVPDAQQVAPAGPPDGGVRPRLEAAEELQGPVPTPQGGAGVQPGRQGGRSDVQGSRRAVGPAPKLTPRERYAASARVDPRTDDLLAAIAKSGGINAEEARTQGIDPAQMRRRGWRILPVFSRKGLTLDAMAERLSQDGYLPEQYTANALLERLDEALGGRRILAAGGHEAEGEQLAADRDAQVGADWAAELSAPDLLAPEDYAQGHDQGTRALADIAQELIDGGLDEDTAARILERGAIQGASDADLAARLRAAADDARAGAAGARAVAPEQGTTREALSLAQEAPPPAPPAPTPARQQADLFGGKTDQQQAIHDARIAAEQRLQGENVPVTQGPGDLFRGPAPAQGRLDTAEEATPTYNGRQVPPAKPARIESPRGDRIAEYHLREGYDALPPEAKAPIDRVIDANPDPRGLRRRLRSLKGTPWSIQALDGALARAAIEEAIAGRDPTWRSALDSDQKLLAGLKRRGIDAAWDALRGRGIIGSPSKPRMAVMGSFLNCHPTKGCAEACYATTGNYVYEGNILKGELIEAAVRDDPARAGREVAREYKALYGEWKTTALRLFDKGDGEAHWIPFVEALNGEGVRAHIFSKRPEFLSQVSPFNLRLLSVDSTRWREALQWIGQFRPAWTYRGKADNARLIQLWRAAPDGSKQPMILPIQKRGAESVAGRQWRTLPTEMHRLVCPVDGGKVSLLGDGPGEFSCRRCDRGNGVGCTFSATTAAARAKAAGIHAREGNVERDPTILIDEQALRDLANEGEKRLDRERAGALSDAVRAVLAYARTGTLPGGEESLDVTLQGAGPGGDGGNEAARDGREGAEEPGTRYDLSTARGGPESGAGPGDGARVSGVSEGAVPAKGQLEVYSPADMPPRKPGEVASAAKVRHVKVGTFDTPYPKLNDVHDAAALVRDLGLNAQEHMVAIVADKNGKPLQVLRHTIGTTDSASVYPGVLFGAIHSVPRAAKVWFAHNHPNGKATHSKADRDLTSRLLTLFENTGIEVANFFTITPQGASEDWNGETFDTSRSYVEARRKWGDKFSRVPVTERQFERVGVLSKAVIDNSMAAKEAVREISEGETGVLLLDGGHRPVAWVPITEAEMGVLRTGKVGKGVSLLGQIASQSNSVAALISVPQAGLPVDVMGSGSPTMNLASALSALEVRTLDVIYDQGSQSLSSTTGRQTWELAGGRPFFSRATGAAHGLSVDHARAVVDQALERLSVRPAVVVVASPTDAAVPAGLRYQIEADGVAPEAALYRSRVYVFADNISSPDRLQTVLLDHELRHIGLRGLLEQDLPPILRHAWAGPEHDKIADFARAKGIRTDSDSGILEAVEEYVVDLAERGEDSGLLTRIYGAIREWLRRHGFDLQVTDADLRAIVARAGTLMQRGRASRPEGLVMWSRRADVPRAPAGESMIRALSGDAQSQLDWLEEQARQRGYADPEAMLAADPEGFLSLADQWRAEHPADTLYARRYARGQGGQPRPGPLRRVADLYTERVGDPLWEGLKARTLPLLTRAGLAENLPPEAARALRAWRAEVGRAGRRALEVGKSLETMPPAEREMLSDLVEGLLGAQIPPQHVQTIAATVQGLFNDQADELVRLGMLSEAAAERWRDEYLPRYYARHLIEAPLDRMFRRARKKIDGQHLRGRGLWQEVPAADASTFLAMDAGWEVRDPGVPEGADIARMVADGQLAADAPVMVWRDWKPEERARWGEIRDALYRIVRGYMEGQRDVATGRLFERLAQTVARAEPVEGYIQVPTARAPGTRVPRYGKLAGLYVPREVWDSLSVMYEPKGELQQAYLRALSLWKEGKVVWNPVAHSNNIMSNLAQLVLGGYNPADPGLWRRTAQEWRRQGPYYQEAQDSGLFGTDFVYGELEAVLPDPLAGSSLGAVGASRLSRFLDRAGRWTGLRQYREGMRRLYQAEDAFLKLMVYAESRRQGMTQDEAYEEAQRYLFDYSNLPRTVRAIKNSPLGIPFVSYAYSAAPMLMRTLLRTPWRLLPLIALFGGIDWLSQAYLFDDDDEDLRQREEQAKPEYMRGLTAVGTPKAVRLPMGEAGEEAWYWDVSRKMPLGDLWDITNQAGGIGIPAPIMPSNPVFTLLTGLLANRDLYSGREIFERYDDALDMGQRAAGYILRQLVPNAPVIPGSYSFNKLVNGLAHEVDAAIEIPALGASYTGQDYYGREQTLARAIADTVGGIKLRKVDVARELDRAWGKDQGAMRDLRADLRALERNQSIGPELRARRMEELRQRAEVIEAQRQ